MHSWEMNKISWLKNLFASLNKVIEKKKTIHLIFQEYKYSNFQL